MAQCKNCGYDLEEGMDFCPQCGKPVNGENLEGSDENTSTNEEYDYSSWYEKDIFHAALSPLIKSFDNGRFFLNTAIVIIDILFSSFLISQPYAAYQMYHDHELQGLETADKTVELVFAIIWLIIAIFSFGYWMKRLNRVKNLVNPEDEFVVIPLGTYLLQWFGEWLSIVLGIGGIFAIIVSLFDVHTSSFVLTFISQYGFGGGVMAIIIGIVIVFVFRLFAENIRAFAAIANNTSRLNTTPRTTIELEDNSNDTYYNVLYGFCIFLTLLFMLLAINQ